MSIFGRIFGSGAGGAKVRKPRMGSRVSMEERADMVRVRDRSAQSVILVDISSSGARIATPLRLGKDEDLTLTVYAGKQKPFELGCRVVAIRPRLGRMHFDYGVKFTAVRAGDADRLRAFVTERDDSRKSGHKPFNPRLHR